MRAAVSVVVIGLVALACVASADDTATGPAPTASPAPAGSNRLNLGPAYRSVSADDPAALLEDLHFHEQIEVHGKAMDARSLTLKMAWWMKDFEPMRGATPSNMSAPSIREMRDYRPHPADSLDLVPAIQWLTDKLSGKKKE